MDEVTIVPLGPHHIAQIEGWAPASAVETLLKRSRMAEATGGIQGWVALRGEEPVAVATVTSDGRRGGYLDFFVVPAERRHGLGGRMIEHALAQPEVKELGDLRALVEFDNTAAQKILSRHGFSNVGYSSDDRMKFERH